VRRLLVLAVVGAALWGAPGAFAAGWCGSGESAVERPDTTTGAQVHAVWVVPADSPDTFATGAGKLSDDLTSLSTWWVGQDPTRTPRVDTAAFAAGSCADLSFVRLAEPASAFAGANNAYASVTQELETAGFANLFKKYVVYYDGPTVEADVCGTGAGDFSSGPSFAIVWLQACPDVPSDAIEAHELLHALGALPAGAPNACTAANNPVGAFADPGHPCDSNKDVLYPEATRGVPLSQLVLDFNHDDYYAHPGTWDDIQDSDWLHLLAAPIVPLAVKIAGAGVVTSVMPGVVCSSSCTTQWDGGTETALLAQAVHGKRFVGWSGSCTGRADCAVTLGSPVSVTATFGPTRVPVALGKVGKGTVTCTPKCGKTFVAGSRLMLHAVPAKGWKFAAWTGDCAKDHVATCLPKTDFHVSARAIFRRR
jgi:Divergent InlB B-repeat domain